MNAFGASENCDAFIVFRSFPSQEKSPENSNQNRSSLKVQITLQKHSCSFVDGLMPTSPQGP